MEQNPSPRAGFRPSSITQRLLGRSSVSWQLGSSFSNMVSFSRIVCSGVDLFLCRRDLGWSLMGLILLSLYVDSAEELRRPVAFKEMIQRGMRRRSG